MLAGCVSDGTVLFDRVDTGWEEGDDRDAVFIIRGAAGERGVSSPSARACLWDLKGENGPRASQGTARAPDIACHAVAFVCETGQAL